jgi:hypothetical protein
MPTRGSDERICPFHLGSSRSRAVVIVPGTIFSMLIAYVWTTWYSQAKQRSPATSVKRAPTPPRQALSSSTSGWKRTGRSGVHSCSARPSAKEIPEWISPRSNAEAPFTPPCLAEANQLEIVGAATCCTRTFGTLA